MSPSSAPPPDPHSDQPISDRFLSIRKRIDQYDQMKAITLSNSKERFQRARSTLSEQLRLRKPEEKITKLYNV